MFGLNRAEMEEVVKEVLDDVLGGAEGKDKIELEKEIEDLKKNIRELEHKKSLEEREIQHLVKMKEEKIQIETEKKQLELQASFDKRTMELQKDYHEKVLKLLADEHNKMQVIYKEIMTRLPNVNLAIRQENKGG
jgi:hypothetical protein